MTLSHGLPVAGVQVLLTPDGQGGVTSSYTFEIGQAHVLLTDADNPPEVFHGIAIAASSPKGKKSQFAKSATVLYMPVWTRGEVKDFDNKVRSRYAALAYAAEGVEANFNRWGGIARYLFMTPEKSQLAMQEAFTSISNTRSASNILAALGGRASSDDVIDRLCHLQPNPKFLSAKREIASNYVLDELVELRFDELMGGELRAILSLAGLSDAAGLRGYIFERYLHRLFRSSPGTTFAMRSLEDGSISALTLPTGLTAQRFRDVALLQKDTPGFVVQDRVYYWPEAGAKPLQSGDAFMYVAKDNVLYIFQDTVSSSHPVKVKGLEDIIALAPTKAPPVQVHIVFRLPEDKFPDMTAKQPYHNLQDHVYKAALPAVIQPVKQFVLKVPVSSAQ